MNRGKIETEEAYDDDSKPTQKEQNENKHLHFPLQIYYRIFGLAKRTTPSSSARLLQRCERLEKQISDIKYENRQLKKKARIEVEPSTGISIIHLFDTT